MPNRADRHAVDLLRSRRIGASTCFLCGRRLGSRNRSDEHVVPRWVQDRFNLCNKRLILLNGTRIPYRQLVIPCCRTCNNEKLAPREQRMQQAIDQGPEAVEALDRLDLFLWLGKIFYALLYKEHFLQTDRRQADLGAIVEREQLRRFDVHYIFLQAILGLVEFRHFFPASIFVFETQRPDNQELQFDLADNFETLAVSMRLGRVGFLATLQDGGAQQMPANPWAEFRRMRLHPLQWRQLTAMYFYGSTLLNRVPKYIILENEGLITVVQMPLGGFGGGPILDDWDNDTFAPILAQYTGVPLDQVYVPPQTMTWLNNPDGSQRFMDIADIPWPLRP
jgi:hypothetical protein